MLNYEQPNLDNLGVRDSGIVDPSAQHVDLEDSPSVLEADSPLGVRQRMSGCVASKPSASRDALLLTCGPSE